MFKKLGIAVAVAIPMLILGGGSANASGFGYATSNPHISFDGTASGIHDRFIKNGSVQSMDWNLFATHAGGKAKNPHAGIFESFYGGIGAVISDPLTNSDYIGIIKMLEPNDMLQKPGGGGSGGSGDLVTNAVSYGASQTPAWSNAWIKSPPLSVDYMITAFGICPTCKPSGGGSGGSGTSGQPGTAGPKCKLKIHNIYLPCPDDYTKRKFINK